MTLLQEAYTLMQRQPEKNIRLIVDLLQTMSTRENTADQASAGVFRRTGLAKGAVSLPGDFDETFDALDNDIEGLFYGDSL